MENNELSTNRIMWFSNAPWAPTGYGNQTGLFVQRIKRLGYEMGVTAFYGLQARPLAWDGVTVYPGGRHPYGADIMGAHAQHFKANMLITLIDAWVLDPRPLPSSIAWAPWFPVDMEPLPGAVYEKVKLAAERIVFSRFGEKMVNDAGLDCRYVPHGVDTKVLYPMPMSEARQAMKWPEDRFIVGMVAANKGTPSRKSFPWQLEAFAEFKKTHKDALLYMHTMKGHVPELAKADQAINLPEICDFLGLKWGDMGQVDSSAVDVLFAPQYEMVSGLLNDDYMRQAYSAMDVHMTVSMGEGFGIPILEAQACGCPVIVGDWTSMGELCFSGWMVDKSDADKWWTPLAAYQYAPRPGAIVDCLRHAYDGKGRDKFREKARAGAMAYDADLVTQDYWKPVLFDMFQELHKPESMPSMSMVRF
jgi:glycosyltransferase involved in cell wall biosynthesis